MGNDKNVKVWKASRTAGAGVVVFEDSAQLIGSKDAAVIADNKGVSVVGPISMVSDAANIRRGGLFIGLNDFLDMIPSTIVTPIPKQIPMAPIVGIQGLTKDVAFFLALLA